MSDYFNKKTDGMPEEEQHVSTAMALDDEQRVKVLSPSMLVFRRFIRNRLAIVGVLFITAMFLFSFVGGWLMPYGESEVFKKYVDMSKLYAGVTINNEYRYVEAEGKMLPSPARAQFVLALNSNQDTFESQGQYFILESKSDELHVIFNLVEVARAIGLRNVYDVTPTDGFAVTDAFEQAFLKAIEDKAEEFSVDGKTYAMVLEKKIYIAL
jgi:peptide/nickel transport system permease protein